MTTTANPTTDDTLPAGWKWARLGEVAKLVRGVSYTKNDEVHAGGHQVLRANNIAKESARLDLSEIKYVSDSLQFSPDKKLLKDDIFICLASGSKDHIGKVALVSYHTDYYFGAFMGAIRVDHRQIGSNYLFHQLQHSRFNNYLRSQISSTNINNLSAKVLYRFPIPLPPLSEQKRIAGVLDECLAAVARAKQAAEAQLEAAVALPAAYLRQALPAEGDDLPAGWKWARLGEVCEINPKRPPGLQRDPSASTTFVPMSAVDANTNAITQPEQKSFSEVSRGYTYFEQDDVLFAKITPCMENGKHAIAKNLIGGFGFGSTEFHVIRHGEDITPKWIHNYVRQSHLLMQATHHFRGAVGQQRLPKEFLSNLSIPLPPLDEQRRIASVLDAQIEGAGTLVSRIREQLEAIDALPGAYLSKAFAGEI